MEPVACQASRPKNGIHAMGLYVPLQKAGRKGEADHEKVSAVSDKRSPVPSFRKGMKEQGFRYVLWELAKERTHKNSGCVGVLAANDPKYKYSVEWRV